MAPPSKSRAKRAVRGCPAKKKPPKLPGHLLAQAEAAAAAGDPDAASELVVEAYHAISSAPAAYASNAELHERAGVLLLELGHPDAALDCLLKSVAAAPNSGHTKYLNLAQLHSGEEALAYLDQGIAILKARISAPPTNGTASSSSVPSASAAVNSASPDDLASAWCARCELFMTDLCDRPDAEDQCELSLTEALSVRADSAEALQQRAGLRLVQQRPEEALTDLRRSMELWMPRRRQAAEADSADPDECGLTAEQRLRCAEMLIELGQLESCLDVLDFLLEEDDEVAQVWLLFGLAYSRLANPTAARFHLQKAKALVEPDDPVAVEIDQLLADLPTAESGDESASAGQAMDDADVELETELEEENGDGEEDEAE